jgi:6-phosphogluconate dehydrogenase
MLMQAAAKALNWHLNYGAIAMLWRNGCIIRSQFLGKIKNAFDKDPNLGSLLFDPFFCDAIRKAESGWRKAVCSAAENGVPAPCFSAALAFFDGFRTRQLPANLLQAQRDYFGAHTYERVDAPRGKFFHTNWTGTGGTTSSSSYNV